MWCLLLFVQLFLALGCDDTELLEHTRTLLQEMGPGETGGGVEEDTGVGEEGEDRAECSSEPGKHQDTCSMDVT